MSELAEAAGPVVVELSSQDEAQLYQQVALRLRTVADHPEQAGDLRLEATYQADLMGPLDALEDIGRRFVARFLPDAYELACGNSDVGERKKVSDAFGLGPAAVGGAIAGVLVGSLGLAPAVAAVLAALIMRLFFENAYQAMCDVWKQRLPQVNTGPDKVGA
jgi:Flp pilus assembly protein TadB